MKIFSLIAAASAAKSCKWKTYCTDISASTEVTNSWTCKDCFNVRVQADLNHVADGNWFSNKDSVYVAFDDEVNFIKAAGPVDEVTYWGENDGAHIYQIDFIVSSERERDLVCYNKFGQIFSPILWLKMMLQT